MKKLQYEEFLSYIMLYKATMENFSDLHKIGFDFYEAQYQLVGQQEKLLTIFLNSHFDKLGVEAIEWYIYENDYGQKDWSNTNDIIHGATDQDGKPICYSYESLWEHLQPHLK